MFLVFKAYWPSMRRYWYLFAGVLFFLFLSVAANAARPFMYEGLTNTFAAPEMDEDSAYWLLKLLATALLIGWFFWRCVDWCLASAESRIMRDLEERSFIELNNQSMSFHAVTPAGLIVKNAIKFREVFEGIMDILSYQMIRDLIMVSLAFATFYYKNPAFAWLFVYWLAAFAVLNLIVLWVKFPMDKRATKASSAVSGVLADSLGAHLTVKAYGHEKNEEKRLEKKTRESERYRWISWVTNIICTAMQGLLMVGFEILLIHKLIEGKKQGNITAGDFVFYQSAVANMFFLLWMFGHNLRILCQNFADAREMAEVFSKEPEVRDVPGATELKVTQGRIELHDVRHSYNGGGKKELDGIDLIIEAGKRVAVVGKTGSGKTTLFKAIMRFFDLKGGSILIDGVDIATVTQKSLRQNFALVPQRVDLFNDTILTNMLFAKPDTTEDEVIDALKRARIWDRICEFKEGLQTKIGEHGVLLSGGEQQRLAIARAILANRPILIMDEATSALDPDTELLVQEALAEVMEGKTSLTIAHRLSTIMYSDVIVVLEKGKIVEIGTHDELLAKKGVYYKLWSHQSGGYMADE
jgi:ABC-type multidrug transport system fused ATPase/permease subunit